VNSRVPIVLGFLLHAAVGGAILVSGLIIPLWAVGALALVWLSGLVVAIRSRTRPGVVLAVPFVTLAIVVLTAWAGETFLDWTA